MRGNVGVSQNPGFEEVVDGDAGASWFTPSQAVAVGAVLGLVVAFGSLPALASNEASGYREKDQSIISYNGNKAVGAKNRNLPEEDELSKSFSLQSKLGGLKVSVAPEAQITLEELEKIDPKKTTKK